MRVLRLAASVVPLFMLVASTANCGSSPEDGVDDGSTTSEEQAMVRESYGTCIHVFIKADGWWALQGHVRARIGKGSDYYGSELDIQVEDHNNPVLANGKPNLRFVTQKRGHEIDDDFSVRGGTRGRAWAWEPCDKKWIVTPWVRVACNNDTGFC
jgi:hypothetical protein